MRKGFIVALVVVSASFIFFMITRPPKVVYEPVVIPPLDAEQRKEIVAVEAKQIVREIEAFPPVEEIEYRRRGFSAWEHDLLYSPSSLRRAEAVRALHAFGPTAVPVLTDRIENDEDLWVRKWAIFSLGEMGGVAKDAIPLLMKVLAEEEPFLLRRTAASSLGKMGPIAAEALPLLIEALKDDEWSMRLEAVGALGGIGPLAQDAIPRLTELLDDENALVRFHSRASLRKIR